ncbi:MAG: hypothetical protein RIS79_2911 [Verrucomicrobiota bacterium]|jgi:hypothetical protein
MPFDPNIPAANAELTSAMFRGQFTGLKDLIDNMSGITSVVVDAVNTLPPGSNAAVNVNFDGTNVHFIFDIPHGNNGPTGATGQPGEVSLTDLNNAQLSTLGQCSNNSNNVATLDTPMGDPESEVLRQKVDELINALRR